MRKRVLITGGAGFIGSPVADLLLDRGYSGWVLDSLTPQVHGLSGRPPAYLNPEAEFIMGDVRDAHAVERALADIDAVIHLAAFVGVGQSMYDMVSYIQVNECGTAVLLEALAKRPVRRLVVASSMSIYGEGAAGRADRSMVSPSERSLEQLRRGAWEIEDEEGALTPIPTPETKQPSLSSVYALNKYAQERLCLIAGRAYGIPTVALRFFNVFGTRQALSNPYTGVLAIFASRLLNDNPPMIFEDGLQQRDFVSVYDIAQACRLALEHGEAAVGAGVFNVGSGRPRPGVGWRGGVFNGVSGRPRTVLEVAQKMAGAVGKPHVEPEGGDRYRVAEIR